MRKKEKIRKRERKRKRERERKSEKERVSDRVGKLNYKPAYAKLTHSLF